MEENITTMIITPETINKRDRFQVIYPAIACQDNHLWFNKKAIELFRTDEIYFEVEQNKIFLRACRLLSEKGFVIKNQRVDSRKLVNKIKQIVGTTGLPKFKVEMTFQENVFQLIQMK